MKTQYHSALKGKSTINTHARSVFTASTLVPKCALEIIRVRRFADYLAVNSVHMRVAAIIAPNLVLLVRNLAHGMSFRSAALYGLLNVLIQELPSL